MTREVVKKTVVEKRIILFRVSKNETKQKGHSSKRKISRLENFYSERKKISSTHTFNAELQDVRDRHKQKNV